MDASETSNTYTSISDDVISKTRSELVFNGELEEISVLSEVHATWKRKMIQAGVVSGTIETSSASFPSPVTAPLQTQDPNPLPGYAESGIDIDAQSPYTDLVMSIKNEHDGFHIPHQDGASDGFYIPPLDGATDGDAVTKTNTYSHNAEDEEVLNEDDDDEEVLNEDDDEEEDGINDDKDILHLIMCQFDNVKKRKNKWKCNLKAGVMQINGKHVLFSEAKGDFTF